MIMGDFFLSFRVMGFKLLCVVVVMMSFLIFVDFVKVILLMFMCLVMEVFVVGLYLEIMFSMFGGMLVFRVSFFVRMVDKGVCFVVFNIIVLLVVKVGVIF